MIDVPEGTPPKVAKVKGKKAIKVTSSQVSTAQPRVAADQQLGTMNPSWLVRISKLGPRNPLDRLYEHKRGPAACVASRFLV